MFQFGVYFQNVRVTNIQTLEAVYKGNPGELHDIDKFRKRYDASFNCLLFMPL